VCDLQSKGKELKVWKEQVDKKMKNIVAGLRRVRDRNSALASAEQLSADNFTVCDVLARQMRSEGHRSNQALRALLQNQVRVSYETVLVIMRVPAGVYVVICMER
jgi:CRISPR/Cas system-associated endonuclease Cas1